MRKRLVRNAFRAYVNAVDAHACRRMRRAREFANCMWNNQDGFKVRYNDYPRGHYIYFMLFCDDYGFIFLSALVAFKNSSYAFCNSSRPASGDCGPSRSAARSASRSA